MIGPTVPCVSSHGSNPGDHVNRKQPVRSALVTSLEIRPSRFGAPVAQRMVAAAQQDLTQRYGSQDSSQVESIQFDPPEGIFLVAWLDGQPVGCAGWRTIAHFAEGPEGGSPEDGSAEGDPAEGVAELKRMYVHPDARNTGVATALLRELENSARASGMRRMILETGTKQPEAIALYSKRGYERIPNYGHYKDAPDCVSFGRDL